MQDVSFSTKATDFPWRERRLARKIIARIHEIYRQKALLTVVRYGAGHGILYTEAQLLTADELDNHFGHRAPWRT